MLQHFVNHVSIIVDRSASMTGQPVVKVFDSELEHLKKRSIETKQETRITIYLFNTVVECLTFDMDVMRFDSLAGYYTPNATTSLIDAVLKSTQDHKKIPELYGDHAFLQYVFTDGMENASRASPETLRSTLESLPENWTTACLVPDSRSKFEAKKFGFHDDSISIWDPLKPNAFEDVGRQFSRTLDNYMDMRARGVRGTRGLFKIDTSRVNFAQLYALPRSNYRIYPVTREATIRDYVESVAGSFLKGFVYYEPTKRVKVQDYKNILIQDVSTGTVYEGQDLREVLGLPAETVYVVPGDHPGKKIFVQSTSVNRRLFPDTSILVKG